MRLRRALPRPDRLAGSVRRGPGDPDGRVPELPQRPLRRLLGLEAPSLPDFERDAELEKRVLDEILSPAFSGEQPEGLLRVVRFKIRRWWANRWKHRLVFDEGLAGAFVHSAWAHLKRPRSIAH